MKKNSDILIQKLDEFIRKYYKNKLLRGLIYSVALLVLFFLLALLSEYFGNFGIAVRTAIFWFYITLVLCVLGFYVGVPLLKMYKLGKTISYQQAAQIIGHHFPEIGDKLLNTLQLRELSYAVDSSLLEASIEQKTQQLRPFPFFKAIDFSKNKQYLKYALIPVCILLFLSVLTPSFVLGPSKRLIAHNTYYEKPAPFSFQIQNQSLETVQQEDFELKVKIVGDQLPNEVSIEIEGVLYKMKKESKLLFSYEFKNVQKSLNFSLSAAGVNSPIYTLTAHPKPILIDFQVQLQYPAYIGKAAETLLNVGDFAVPKGTVVKWNFQTRDVDTLLFGFNNNLQALVPDANGRLSVSYKIMNNVSYSFSTLNKYIKNTDSLRFTISSVDDAFPQIMALEQLDSLLPQRVYFKGMIKDDYGFSKLQFKISKINKENPLQDITNIVPLNIKPGETAQEFYYFTDLSLLQLMPGDQVEYFFQVWDNDGINGAKMAQSEVFKIVIPGIKEIDQKTEENIKAIQEKASSSMSEIRKMQKEINDMMKKMVDKKDFNWQDKKQLEELAKKEQQLKQAVEDMKQKLEQSNLLEQQYKQLDNSIIEKQKELEKLFKELMNDDLKELFKEIDKMLQQTDKDKIRESLENIKKNNENIEKQLDRDIELMKRLDVEKKLDEAIQKTQELSQKQKDISERTKQKDASIEDIKKEQNKLNEDFQDLKKQLDDIEKKNTQLETPNDLKRNQGLEKEVENAQKDASQKLDKNQKQDAQKQQEKAADKLDEMANDLNEMRSDMESEQLAEDANAIRQLLKNLLLISFNQEKLMNKTASVYVQDPIYQDVIKEQAKLKDDFKTVEDSLLALAKRQMEVSSMVNKELSSINSRMSMTMDDLLMLNQTFYGQTRNNNARTSQQYVMTSVNNLSLVLAESLDKMQDKMRSNSQQKKKNNNKSKSNSSCENPGSTGKSKPKSGSKPDPKTMRELQEQLNKQLQDMKNALEQKNKDGGKKGHKLGEGSEMNKEIARMAAEQERIRQMMQQYSEKLKQESGGKGSKELNDLLMQMEQTETDLVNKTITQQTLLRQQQILTRMLEHEKAEKKQDQEEKRESKEGKDAFFGNQNQFLEYNKLKNKEIEMLRTAPPSFSLFYQQKVNQYFYNFENK